MPRFSSLFLLPFLALVNAQTSSTASCSTTLTPKNAAPSVAPGWDVKLVAAGLTNPRAIIFDSSGHLLVVQQGKGIGSLSLTDNGGSCVTAGSPSDLNHGIELSIDGKTLYASSAEAVYAWDYDAGSSKNTSAPRQLIGGMSTSDHTTRTLLLSRWAPGMLMVSRGSTSNLDQQAEDITSGHSQIKAFNITNVAAIYNYDTDGVLLGWGLRNSVGVAEEPHTGGIYSVENSVDEMMREGQNIHEDNPGEEMNFHGYLNGTKYVQQGGNYGYPSCFAAWDVGTIPDNTGLQVGTQFAIGDQNTTINDTFCQTDRVAPRLTFQAHMAPLDIKFNDNGSVAWITFHGSWDRTNPIGYKLSAVEFANGSPIAPANSNTSAIDIVANLDNSKCPDSCFRPVGLAWDSQGRLFMSSDATGEIYVVVKSDGSSANAATPSSILPASGTGHSASASATKPSAAARNGLSVWVVVIACVVFGVFY
ncbi:soluble quino protein glucose dehydrogenase [Lepidopterella palustris CBS 459.81]|uniref:Soluble quino protein glucose dehydrogenase n=1 Tax=Lepidopterella palustris CBS 459.81 TaxID=1314670 RepID=A0A8E2EA61_9PEZI|nr:soluble quino protein glucose dehydrogenase [Lepidopterella palustris CBS 459.81]